MNNLTSIAALAGRRTDASDAAAPRFPLSAAENVRDRLLDGFLSDQVRRLVCSAAQGADILALEAARALGVPTTIVIPFDISTFRRVSVTDNGGDWGSRYDGLITEAESRRDLITLNLGENEAAAFAAANRRIIDEASRAAVPRRLAFVVWEGQTRGDGDVTAQFAALADAAGFQQRSILTLPQ